LIKIYFTISFLLIVCTNGKAQSSRGFVPAEVFPLQKGVSARFNFTGLLDILDQNISVGGEYKFSEHLSAGTDIAYIFESKYLSESKSSHGIILRPFIRYYPAKGRNGFLEGGFHYKHVSYRITDWIGKDVINGIPSYEQYTTFYFLKNVYELNIKAGTAVNLDRNKKFRCEFYGGLGARFKTQGSHEGSYSRQRGSFFALYNPGYSTISMPIGMRLVYYIKNKKS